MARTGLAPGGPGEVGAVNLRLPAGTRHLAKMGQPCLHSPVVDHERRLTYDAGIQTVRGYLEV